MGRCDRQCQIGLGARERARLQNHGHAEAARNQVEQCWEIGDLKNNLTVDRCLGEGAVDDEARAPARAILFLSTVTVSRSSPMGANPRWYRKVL